MAEKWQTTKSPRPPLLLLPDNKKGAGYFWGFIGLYGLFGFFGLA
jgi:hypothetical protein